MADVVTAGTFIGAALEQAGYIAQERLLDQLTDFFKEAGAFVYILGGLGGVISMVLFGSFRAARYLLLGPAFFFFLVTPRYEYDGVIWKTGAGVARGMNLKEGDAVAKEDINKVLDKTNMGNGGKTIRVAYGFALFTRIINSLTHDLIATILQKQEDGYYRLFYHKANAMQVLLNMKPEDPKFLEMLNSNFVQGCPEMYNYALMRSSYDLRDDALSTSESAKASTIERRNFYQAEFEKYSNYVRVNPEGAAREYYQAGDGQKEVPASFSCVEMWKLVASYLHDQAANGKALVMKQLRANGAEEALACKEIMRKIGDPAAAEGSCELENAVALYMLKNAMTERRSVAQFVKRVADSAAEPAGIKDGTMVNLTSELESDSYRADAEKFARTWYESGSELSGLSPAQQRKFMIGMGEVAAGQLKNEQEKAALRKRIVSQARLSTIGGPLEAGFMDYPRYNLKNLRQQLFTWSVQIPYYQGVLLYVLAVAYPFAALIVLLPGRAAGFLNLPLAWLWVKSWDIGIAMVMVFERVLWNILPSLNVKEQLLKNGIKETALWDSLSEAAKFDHTWNLHMYYTALALATFAIPGLTGYATLRSRRAILSSFTERLKQDAQDAGQMAAGAHGVQVMADRVRTIGELKAAARRAMTDQGEGFGARGREESAEFFGRLAQAAFVASQRPDLVKNLGNGKAFGAALKAVPGAEAAYTKAKFEMLSKEVKADMSYMDNFHPVLGRYGTPAKMNDAYAAAMDGYGGYELNKLYTEAPPVADMVELHVSKMSQIRDNLATIAGANPELAPRIFDIISDPETMPMKLKEFASELGIDTSAPRFMEKTMGVTPGAMRELSEAKANPEEYRKRFTYDPREASQTEADQIPFSPHLLGNLRAQDVLESGIRAPRAHGENMINSGAPELDGMRPSSTDFGDPLRDYERRNPPLQLDGDGASFAPPNGIEGAFLDHKRPMEIEAGYQHTPVSQADALRQAGHLVLGGEGGDDRYSSLRAEDLRMKSLNLDWLNAADEEEERKKELAGMPRGMGIYSTRKSNPKRTA